MAIPARQYVAKTNRAVINPDFSRISDPYVKVSLELQRVFGLRREEAMKIKPHEADKGNQLYLQASWCKGGRERFVPIRTEEQRYWMEEAKKRAGQPSNSLIPPAKTYVKHKHVYEKQVIRAGLRNMHGMRHAYAQALYKEITGWEPPINGGPAYKKLTQEQKQLDKQARITISSHLGHDREQIVKNYCG